MHLAVWVILFSLPVLFYPGELSSFRVVFRMNWIFLFFAGILFYLNYFFLVDFFVFGKKTIWFVIINLLLIAAFTWLNDQLIMNLHRPLLGDPGPPHPPGHGQMPMFKPDRNMFFIRNAGTYLVPVIISLVLRVLKRIKKVEAEKKDIERERLQAELMHLKNQLHPHFFFNSLNNIYALVDISPEKSKVAIHGLAKLIRYLLYETDTNFVKLSQEIDFLKKYTQLMQLRLNDKIKLTTSFPESTGDLIIAPLLFLPLIENVFKHGITSTASKLVIEITTDKDVVIFRSMNEYSPVESMAAEKGIGIYNLKKRLELLYPGKHEFKTEINDRTYFTWLSVKTN